MVVVLDVVLLDVGIFLLIWLRRRIVVGHTSFLRVFVLFTKVWEINLSKIQMKSKFAGLLVSLHCKTIINILKNI